VVSLVPLVFEESILERAVVDGEVPAENQNAAVHYGCFVPSCSEDDGCFLRLVVFSEDR